MRIKLIASHHVSSTETFSVVCFYDNSHVLEVAGDEVEAKSDVVNIATEKGWRIVEVGKEGDEDGDDVIACPLCYVKKTLAEVPNQDIVEKMVTFFKEKESTTEQFLSELVVVLETPIEEKKKKVVENVKRPTVRKVNVRR